MDGPRLITAVVVSNPTFLRCLRRIKDPQRRTVVRDTLRALLLLDLDQPPAKLHLHQLSGRQVPSACVPGAKVTPWTIHVTPDDTLKASFTIEGNTAYLRLCDAHDTIDKNP